MDAGGYGLTVLLAGIVGALRGSEPPSLEHHAAARITHPQHASSTFRYCTNFAVTGTARAAPIRAALEQIGDSVLVVGDPTTFKVHVHTDDPDSATALFSEFGVVSHLDVADMHAQVQQREERLAAPRGAVCGALAVVNGDGMRSFFEGLGCTARGRPTLNPSTYDLLAAIHAVPAEQVVVLPNSANVVMAAERAAELSDKTVAWSCRARRRRAWRPPSASTRPRRRHERRGDGETLEHVRTGAVAPLPATTPRDASARATRSASSRRSSWPGAAPERPCARSSSSLARAPS